MPKVFGAMALVDSGYLVRRHSFVGGIWCDGIRSLEVFGARSFVSWCVCRVVVCIQYATRRSSGISPQSQFLDVLFWWVYLSGCFVPAVGLAFSLCVDMC